MKATLLALLCAVFFTGCGTGIRSAEGKKIGQVVKLGTYGLVCSTYEGELVRGGFSAGSGVAGAAFHFTVLDRKIFEELTSVMEKQQEIEISYTKTMLSGPCASESVSQGFLTSYRVLAPNSDEKERQKQELLKKLRELQ